MDNRTDEQKFLAALVAVKATDGRPGALATHIAASYQQSGVAATKETISDWIERTRNHFNDRYEQYSQYLAAIFKPGDTICFVIIEHNVDRDQAKERVSQKFTTLEDALTADTFMSLLRANNAPSTIQGNSASSVYVAMNSYPADLVGKTVGRTQANVVAVRALQADMDDVTNAAAQVASMQSSAKVPPPSIVVESSTGKRQGIWLVDGIAKDDAKPLMQAIAAEFGTDSAVAEVARVMRVPGFVNCKHAYDDQPVAKLLSNSGTRYSRESFKLENTTADKFERKPEGWLDEPFVRGGIYNKVLSFVGHYMGAKNIDDGDVMFAIIKEHIDRNGCFERDGKTPFSWNETQVRQQVHKLVNEWETGEEKSKPLQLNTQSDAPVTLSSNPLPEQVAAAATAQLAQEEPIEILKVAKDPYPEFPTYVMAGTSLYDNFVKPICDHNSRIDYFMWLPATAMLLNYVGTKVQTKGEFAAKAFNGSQYLVLIGKRGEAIKSSSVDDAMQYFSYMGCLTHDGGGLKTAEGKTVVFTAGSAEGLGGDMQKINCKNALLYYDELEELTKKARIDGSTLRTALLKLYESKKYANTVKATKEKYSLDPDSYCASLIGCTTTEMFPELWSGLSGEDTGLNDRFVFVLQPEVLPERKIKVDINTLPNAAKTRSLIDKAIQQQTFEFEDIHTHAKFKELVRTGNRYVERAKKWALAIAIDLGLSRVDDECMDRGCDIVRYEIAVKKYLKNREAKTPEAEMQGKIKHHLRMNGSQLPTRELKRLCHAEAVGTTQWNRAYFGLLSAGDIRRVGDGKKGSPDTTYLLHDDAAEEAA